MARYLQFTSGEFYHVYTRGVDKRILFIDQADFLRFHQSVALFNDQTYFRAIPNDRAIRLSDLREQGKDMRKRYVDIVTFIYLPNHIHLLLTPMTEQGVAPFIQRILMGYAKYFNKRYERHGKLFETYRAKRIDSEAYLRQIVPYIHCNALDVANIHWREHGVEWSTAKRALDAYPWSGHHVAMRKPQNFPVVQSTHLLNMYPTEQEYITDINRRLAFPIIHDLSSFSGHPLGMTRV